MAAAEVPTGAGLTDIGLDLEAAFFTGRRSRAIRWCSAGFASTRPAWWPAPSTPTRTRTAWRSSPPIQIPESSPGGDQELHQGHLAHSHRPPADGLQSCPRGRHRAVPEGRDPGRTSRLHRENPNGFQDRDGEPPGDQLLPDPRDWRPARPLCRWAPYEHIRGRNLFTLQARSCVDVGRLREHASDNWVGGVPRPTPYGDQHRNRNLAGAGATPRSPGSVPRWGQRRAGCWLDPLTCGSPCLTCCLVAR